MSIFNETYSKERVVNTLSTWHKLNLANIKTLPEQHKDWETVLNLCVDTQYKILLKLFGVEDHE